MPKERRGGKKGKEVDGKIMGEFEEENEKRRLRELKVRKRKNKEGRERSGG